MRLCAKPEEDARPRAAIHVKEVVGRQLLVAVGRAVAHELPGLGEQPLCSLGLLLVLLGELVLAAGAVGEARAAQVVSGKAGEV